MATDVVSATTSSRSPPPCLPPSCPSRPPPSRPSPSCPPPRRPSSSWVVVLVVLGRPVLPDDRHLLGLPPLEGVGRRRGRAGAHMCALPWARRHGGADSCARSRCCMDLCRVSLPRDLLEPCHSDPCCAEPFCVVPCRADPVTWTRPAVPVVCCVRAVQGAVHERARSGFPHAGGFPGCMMHLHAATWALYTQHQIVRTDGTKFCASN